MLNDPVTRGDPEVLAALATSLTNLSAQHGVAGRTSEAIAAAEESVAILRELAATAPPVPSGLPVLPAQRGNAERERTHGDDHHNEHSVNRSVSAGFSRVPALRLSRLGRHSKRWPGLLVAAAAALPAGAWPLLLEVVLYLFARPYALLTAEAISWVAALALVNVGALAAGRRSWSILHQASPSIDDLLIRSEGGERITRWLWRALGRWRQVFFSFLMAAGSCTLVACAEPAIAGALEIGPVSYVAVGWTAFIAGSEAYCVVVVSRLGHQILRQRDLNLVWHSPASTPGIAQLSSGYAYGTSAILVLAIAVEGLALRISTYGDSAVLNTVSIAFPIAAALAALIFGVLPHWWLYLAVRDARRQVLRRLSLPAALPDTAAEVADAQAKISLYRMVESSPGLPFSTASMVQYAAAVISTLIGTLVAIVLGRG